MSATVSSKSITGNGNQATASVTVSSGTSATSTISCLITDTVNGATYTATLPITWQPYYTPLTSTFTQVTAPVNGNSQTATYLCIPSGGSGVFTYAWSFTPQPTPTSGSIVSGLSLSSTTSSQVTLSATITGSTTATTVLNCTITDSVSGATFLNSVTVTWMVPYPPLTVGALTLGGTSFSPITTSIMVSIACSISGGSSSYTYVVNGSYNGGANQSLLTGTSASISDYIVLSKVNASDSIVVSITFTDTITSNTISTPTQTITVSWPATVSSLLPSDTPIFISNIGGSTWSVVPPTILTTYNSVSLSASGFYQLACTSSSASLYTNGTWSTINAISSGKSSAISYTGQNMIVCGTSGVWISLSNGTSWKNPLTSTLYTTCAISGNGSYMLAGQYTASTVSVSISSTYGTTWTNYPTATFPVSNQVSTMSISYNGQYMFVGTRNNGSYTSSNFGSTWTLVAINTNASSISYSGQYQTIAVYGGEVYVSYDYGTTWQLTYSVSFNWTGLAMTYDAAVQLGCVYGGGVYYSVDYGQTWTLSTLSTTANWNCVGISALGNYTLAGIFNGYLWQNYLPNSINMLQDITFQNMTFPNTFATQLTTGLSVHFGSSSPFFATVSSIPGLQVWLDANSLSLTNGASLTASSWSTSGGTAYTASVTSTTFPTFSTATGKKSVYFSGNQNLSIPNVTLGQHISVFMVCYPTSTAGGLFLEQGPNENINPGFYLHSAGGQNFAINDGVNGQRSVHQGNTTIANAWQLIEGVHPDPSQSNNMAYYMNGEYQVAISYLPSYTNNVAVTSNLNMNVRITNNVYLGELLIYNSPLTTLQRKTVESYLANKWGITLSYTPIPFSAGGSNAIHSVHRGNTDYAIMIFADNVLTSIVMPYNNASIPYTLYYDLGASCYTNSAQASVSTTAMQVIITDQSSTIANQIQQSISFSETAAASTLPFTQNTLSYTGTGTGSVALTVKASTTGLSTFIGSIDNLVFATNSYPYTLVDSVPIYAHWIQTQFGPTVGRAGSVLQTAFQIVSPAYANNVSTNGSFLIVGSNDGINWSICSRPYDMTAIASITTGTIGSTNGPYSVGACNGTGIGYNYIRLLLVGMCPGNLTQLLMWQYGIGINNASATLSSLTVNGVSFSNSLFISSVLQGILTWSWMTNPSINVSAGNTPTLYGNIMNQHNYISQKSILGISSAGMPSPPPYSYPPSISYIPITILPNIAYTGWSSVCTNMTGQYVLACCNSTYNSTSTTFYTNSNHGTTSVSAWKSRTFSVLSLDSAMSSSGQYQVVATSGGIYVNNNYGASGSWTNTYSTTPPVSVACSASGQFMMAVYPTVPTASSSITIGSNSHLAITQLPFTVPGTYTMTISGQSGSFTCMYTNGTIYTGNASIPNFGIWNTNNVNNSKTNVFNIYKSGAGGTFTVTVTNNGTNATTMVTSSDYGVTWTSVTPPSGANLYHIRMSDSGQYIIGCGTGGIYVSSTFGKTWTRVSATIYTISPNKTGISGTTPGTATPVSTTWTQSGVTWTCTASSVATAGMQPWILFDGITSSSSWASSANYAAWTGIYNNTFSTTVLGGVGLLYGDWIQLQSSVPAIVTSYSFTDCTPGNVPSMYYIVGSSDGTNWFPIQYVSMNTNPFTTNFNTSTFINVSSGTQFIGADVAATVTSTTYPTTTTLYTHFRLIATKTFGGPWGNFELGELTITFSASNTNTTGLMGSISSTGQYMTIAQNPGYICSSSNYGSAWTRYITPSATVINSTVTPTTLAPYGLWTLPTMTSTGQHQQIVNYFYTGSYGFTHIYKSTDYGSTWSIHHQSGAVVPYGSYGPNSLLWITSLALSGNGLYGYYGIGNSEQSTYAKSYLMQSVPTVPITTTNWYNNMYVANSVYTSTLGPITQLCNAPTSSTNQSGGCVYGIGNIQHSSSFTISFQFRIASNTDGPITYGSGGNNVYFFCGHSTPKPLGTGSVWYTDTCPGMYVNFQVYTAQYYLPDAGTFLTYAYQGASTYSGVNTTSNTTSPPYLPFCYANYVGQYGSQNTARPSGIEATSFFGNPGYNTVRIRYNNSAVNTWTVELNGVTVIQHSNPQHNWWAGQSGPYWGIGSNNYSTSGGCMNTYIQNVFINESSVYNVQYLIVAGGGGGGYSEAAGGGAGGVLLNQLTLAPGTVYNVTVGNGGAGGVAPFETGQGKNGQDSIFGLMTAIGGGGGASSSGNATNIIGLNGGSGGGSCTNFGLGTPGGLAGTGVAGQGFAGGRGATDQSWYRSGGGGGGAGGVGGDAPGAVSGSQRGGNGGVGRITTIITPAIAIANSVGHVSSGSVYFGGGGGGATNIAANVGIGGLGGGGNGAVGTGIAGTVNTGGGGGGGNPGSAGGSGVVILSIPTVNYSGIQFGATVVTNGINTVLIWKSGSGSYTA
jgi:hypothetical protein